MCLHIISMHELIVLWCVQIPNFHKLSIISLAAAVMSIGYSTIAIGVAAHSGKQPGTEYNLNGFTRADGVFGIFNSLGTIAFAYGGHNVVMEIQVSLHPLLFLSPNALLPFMLHEADALLLCVLQLCLLVSSQPFAPCAGFLCESGWKFAGFESQQCCAVIAGHHPFSPYSFKAKPYLWTYDGMSLKFPQLLCMLGQHYLLLQVGISKFNCVASCAC